MSIAGADELNVTFRDAERSDLPQLVALDAICFLPGTAYPAGVMRHFAFSSNSKSIVALNGETMVGLIIIRLSGSEGEIVTIDVHPSSRRGGLGSSLMVKAEDWVASRGVPLLSLEVDEDNLAAVTLYRKRGFTLHERFREERKSRFVMVKVLE